MKLIQPKIFLYFFLLILVISGFFFTVVWPYKLGFYSFIVFVALGGLGVASYIHYTKKCSKPLVCLMGSDCDVVINSRYSKFLGVSLEYWGIFYYSTIIISYIFLILYFYLIPEIVLLGLVIVTTGAFIFSLYLLFVQAFLLKQWCIWCLLSAMLSIVIFTFSLVSLSFALSFLKEIVVFIEAIRALGFVLGMGGATTVMLLFIRFLRDFDIDDNELKTLKNTSELIWLGLVFTLIGNFYLYIIQAETLSQSGSFLVEMVALFVVIISGAVLMIIFSPLIAIIPFTEPQKSYYSSSLESLKKVRKTFFVTGAIALSSWYFAFSINYLPNYRLGTLFLIYFAILVISVITALFLEKKISQGSTKISS